MKNLIQRNLKGKKISILFFLTTAVYVFMLTVTIPRLMNYAGGMAILDMMPTGYTIDYVHSLFNALGAEGRNYYLLIQIPVDLIYPFLFGITYCLLFAFIINKLGKQQSFFYYICLLPLIAALFDYLENMGIVTMLIGYPENVDTMAGPTNIFSVVKSASTTIYFICLTVALLWLLVKYIRSRSFKA